MSSHPAPTSDKLVPKADKPPAPAKESTFLGMPIGSPSVTSKEALQDWGAIMRAKRTSGADVAAAFAHGLPDFKALRERPTSWADLVQRTPHAIAGKMLLGAGAALVAAAKTDFTKGTEVAKVVDIGTGAVNSACNTATCAVDSDVSGTLDSAKDCVVSTASCLKAARIYAKKAAIAGAAATAAGVGGTVGSTAVGAAVVGAAVIDAPQILENSKEILLDKNKRAHALYGDSVTNKGREWVEAMKKDLKHAGDPLQNPTKSSNILDVPISEPMKRAAANAVTDFIAAKTGLKVAAEAYAKQPPPLPAEQGKIEQFLQQTADTLQQMRDTGEAAYRQMPAKPPAKVEVEHTDSIETTEPEREVAPSF